MQTLKEYRFKIVASNVKVLVASQCRSTNSVVFLLHKIMNGIVAKVDKFAVCLRTLLSKLYHGCNEGLHPEP